MAELPSPTLLPPRPPVDWRTLRLWQIQPLRDAAIILAIIGVLYLGKLLSVVTVPMLLALLLAYLFEPVVGRLTGTGRFSRQGAAITIIVAGALIIVGPVVIGGGFAGIQGVSVAQRFLANASRLAEAVAKPDDQALRAALPNQSWRNLANRLVQLRIQAEKARAREAQAEAAPPVPEDPDAPREAPLSPSDQTSVQLYRAVQFAFDWIKANSQTIGRQALATGVSALEIAYAWTTYLITVVVGAALTAFFFYFFCTGYGEVLAFWHSLIPDRKRGQIIDLVRQMDQVINGFVRGRLTICALLVLYYTVAYWAIGVPAPLILGPIVGVLCLMPYIAGVVGIPVAMLLLWAGPTTFEFQSAWWWIVFAPIGVSSASQILDDYILTPAIQGRSTGMDTPTILFASLSGAVLAGFYGLLVAIPVAACIKILLREVVWPRLKEWGEGRARDPLPISRL